jgi:hypothetical protein
MKRLNLAQVSDWLGILALGAGIQALAAQTWIQWSASAGGNNHYYALTPFATNWDAAEQLAVAWGGALATINSSNEQKLHQHDVPDRSDC